MATIIVNPFYVSGGGGGASTLNDGLVAWYDLDTDGTDDLGSLDLSSAGSPSFGTVGGYACVTTSPGNHLYRNSASSFGLDTFSASAWVYRTGSSINMQAVKCGGGVTSGTTRWDLRITGDDARILVSDGATNVSFDVVDVVTVNTWVLVTITYDSSTGAMGVYVDDGTSFTTGNSGYTTLNASYSGIGIGGDEDGGGTGNEFEGSIRSVGVWNRVLTSDERTELYNSGVPLSYADFSV